MEIEQIDA